MQIVNIYVQPATSLSIQIPTPPQTLAQGKLLGKISQQYFTDLIHSRASS